jgi:hypothetical protein
MHMRARHQSLFTVVFAVFAVACSHVTEPSEPQATVVVQRDTLVASVVSAGAVDWMQFTIPLAIHNTTSAPLTFDICFSSIDTQRSGDWQSVWSPYCALTTGSNAPIQPGETREVSVSIVASIQGPGGPPWGSATVNGTYRFTAGLLPSGFVGAIPRIGSNAFTLMRGN